MEDCEHTLRLNPNFTKAKRRKASVLLQKFEFSTAIKILKELLETDRENTVLKKEIEDYEHY